MVKCDSCYYCKMTNGKCAKKKNQEKSNKCKEYIQSSVKR